jgi:archaellum component FlaC
MPFLSNFENQFDAVYAFVNRIKKEIVRIESELDNLDMKRDLRRDVMTLQQTLTTILSKVHNKVEEKKKELKDKEALERKKNGKI